MVRLVHSGAPRVSPGSFGFVSFIRACPWGRCVHSDSFASLTRPGGEGRPLRLEK